MTITRLVPTLALFAILAPVAYGQQQAPLTFSDTPPATTAPTQQPAVGSDPAFQQPAYGQPPQAAPAQFPADPAAMGAGPQPGAMQPGAMPGAPQPGFAGAMPGMPAMPPAPPFVLDKLQLDEVYQQLKFWQAASDKVKTFKSDFTRLEYDKVWNDGSERPMIVSTGVLSYSKPDRGSFEIQKIRRWTKTDPNNAAPEAPGDYVEQDAEIGEHWVCDGKAVYEYDQRNKQLRETVIPVALRGANIVDGPLPFLFGAQADKLMERYWIRVKQSDAAQIFLEAYPRRQSDAVNYERVEVILDRKTMQPTAIQVYLPGGQQRHVYTFAEPSINGTMDAVFGSLFKAPLTPIGWKRVRVDETELPPATPPQSASTADPLQR
jgi:TIGR03009 family protein